MNGRRVLFTDVRTAIWEEIPVPSDLKPRDVLVRTVVSLVSAGTEIAIYTGSHIGFTIPKAPFPRFPIAPGYAMAGEVVAVGSAVTEFAPGDRVAGYGRHATHYACNLDKAQLFRIPDGITVEQAVLARLADISLHAVRRADIEVGEAVAVFGQGLIGQFALQLSLHNGARIAIAVDTIDERLQVAHSCGATCIVNPQREDVLVVTHDLTGGRGLDVAIEASGNPSVISTALKVVGDLGRVVLLGAPRGRVEIDPYTDVFRKGVSLIGSSEHTAPRVETPWNRWTRPNNYVLCLDLARRGILHTDGLISHRVPAREALSVFASLADRPSDYLGVILDWREESKL